MGITVISAPAASTANTNAPNVSAAPVSDGIALDFASLLTGQIAGLPQETNNLTSAKSVQELKSDSEKDSKLIRDLLTAQDTAQAAQNAIPNITATIENRPKIGVDRNTLISSNQQPNAPLSEPGNDARNAGILNKLNDAGSDRTLANVTPLVLNTPSKIDANPSAAYPSALSSLAQTSSDTTAILAGEAGTGNTTSSTFATLMAGHSTQAQQTQHTIPSITTPIQDNRWAQDFSERIVWVAKNDQQVAQINISPAQLGPVQITLNLNGDQASIAFASPHAEVRKAIEDAMPNLREMLSTAGINLGQSNVGAQLQQQQRDTSSLFANGNRSTGETAILPADSHSGSISTGLPIQRGRGLVDLFA